MGWTEVSVPPGDVPGARRVEVLVWYPARRARAVEPFRNNVPGIGVGGSNVAIETPTRASRDAPPTDRRYPLVVLSHGYGNHPEWLSWLGEGLAARGYVVAAPRHQDPPYIGPQSLADPIVFRALDQAVVARGVAESLIRRTAGAAPSIDPGRLAVIGYSMGGFGALRASGAAFNPKGAPATVAGERLSGLLADGDRIPRLLPELDALVLLAPWGGQKEISAFTAASLAHVRAPALVFAGDKDVTSGYEDGVTAMFGCLGARRRWLVTFKGAGHNIGLNSAPTQPNDPRIAGYFEDPIWPKPALHAASLHFIEAFLDRELKGRSGPDPFADRPGLRRAVGSSWSDRIDIESGGDTATCSADAR